MRLGSRQACAFPRNIPIPKAHCRGNMEVESQSYLSLCCSPLMEVRDKSKIFLYAILAFAFIQGLLDSSLLYCLFRHTWYFVHNAGYNRMNLVCTMLF